MQYLPFDIYNHIKNILAPYESYSLSLTCCQYNQNYNKHIFDKINERLLHIFDDKLPALKNLMRETGCVISGSFIIQCLLDEKWTDSDIDFYIPLRDNEITPLPPYLKNKMEDFMYEKMKYNGSRDSTYINNACSIIKWIRTYNKKKIQIITIDVDKNMNTIRDFVMSSFDFNICKNIYGYDGNDYLYIHNLNNLLLKETEFKFSYLGESQMDNCFGNVESNISRYKKYVNRGIKFTNNIDTSLLKQIQINDPHHIAIIDQYLSFNKIKSIFAHLNEDYDVYQIRGNIKVLEQINMINISSNCVTYHNCNTKLCLFDFVGAIDKHKHISIFGEVVGYETLEFIIVTKN